MKKKPIDLFAEAFDACQALDDAIIRQHIQHLQAMDDYLPPMQSFFLLTNAKKQTYEFVSKSYEHIMGFEREFLLHGGMKAAFSIFHPEDLPFFVTSAKETLAFMNQHVPIEKRKRISYTWNVRAKNVHGKYLNLLAHDTPVSFDDQGMPVLFLGHNTVVGEGEKKPIISTLKILNDQNEYETCWYKNYTQPLADALNPREQDVLRLLVQNKTSKEIAHTFSISPHTVDTHRRHILKKLNYPSTKALTHYFLQNHNF